MCKGIDFGAEPQPVDADVSRTDVANTLREVVSMQEEVQEELIQRFTDCTDSAEKELLRNTLLSMRATWEHMAESRQHPEAEPQLVAADVSRTDVTNTGGSNTLSEVVSMQEEVQEELIQRFTDCADSAEKELLRNTLPSMRATWEHMAETRQHPRTETQTVDSDVSRTDVANTRGSNTLREVVSMQEEMQAELIQRFTDCTDSAEKELLRNTLLSMRATWEHMAETRQYPRTEPQTVDSDFSPPQHSGNATLKKRTHTHTRLQGSMCKGIDFEEPAPATGRGLRASSDACTDSAEHLLAALVEGKKDVDLGELARRLKREGYGRWCSTAQSLKEGTGGAKQILDDVRKFDIGLCKALLEETRKGAEIVTEESDVILLLGGTGAGKSTLVHVLCESLFEEDEYGDPLLVDDGEVPELAQVHIGNGAQSQTSTVHVVPIPNVDGLVVADTPGFEDTDGPEVEVANVHGIVEFVKKCRRVRLVLLVNNEGIGHRGQGLRRLAGELGSLLEDPERAMRSTTFLFTKFGSDASAGKQDKFMSQVYAEVEKTGDSEIQHIVGELNKQAKQPTVKLVSEFDDSDMDDAAQGSVVLLRQYTDGSGKYHVVYGAHGTHHTVAVPLKLQPSQCATEDVPSMNLKLTPQLRKQLLEGVEGVKGAVPIFVGQCQFVRPLEPACAARVQQAVLARPAIDAPEEVFRVCVRDETTCALREQADVELRAVQSCVTYCEDLHGDGAVAEAGAVWRTVAWRLCRLSETYDVLHDDKVRVALEQARVVVASSLRKRVDRAKSQVVRVAGHDSVLTEGDAHLLQRDVDALEAARGPLEEQVPDVAWGALQECVEWHRDKFVERLRDALRSNDPCTASSVLSQLHMLATGVVLPCDGEGESAVLAEALDDGCKHFQKLCDEASTASATLGSEADLRAASTALSHVDGHHAALHVQLGLAALDQTEYAAAAWVLRDTLRQLAAECAEHARVLTEEKHQREEALQHPTALQHKVSLLEAGKALCADHVDEVELRSLVAGAQKACVSAVDTLCGRLEEAAAAAVVPREQAQEHQQQEEEEKQATCDNNSLRIEVVEALREVP